MVARLKVYNTILKTGFVPVFYMDDPGLAGAFVAQCMAGGVRVVEFTNRGRNALSVFQQLREAFPDLILGIGSVVDARTAALYMANGADFVVSPNFVPDIIDVCNGQKVAMMPGCGSLSEIHQAERMGVEIIKLFPANVYGSQFVKSILAPRPWTRIMPTGGIDVTRDSIQEWFEAGVSCVGIGSSLTKAADVTRTCQQVQGWISHYRKDDI